MDLAAKARASDNANDPEAEAGASWENIPAEQRAAAKANVNVYLDDFISVVQGKPGRGAKC